ncbi:MAG: four helix bundle suffix domain-containing protein [Verrucomicrobiales bacterium]
MSDDTFLPKKGNYQELVAYHKAEIVYDPTFHFCQRFLQRGDRTIDQMVQAARSGKQNIAEGSKASVTSSQMEVKLTNVAWASLEELLIDYGDYLRTRGHAQVDKNSREALYVRRLGRNPKETLADYREFAETRPAETVANIAICLLHQTHYLLDRYLRKLQEDFLKTGGIREQMTAARLERRRKEGVVSLGMGPIGPMWPIGPILFTQNPGAQASANSASSSEW